MARETVIEGVVLAVREREFEGFTNRRTGEQVPGGTSRVLWLGESFTEDPVGVKVSGTESGLLVGLERGQSVVATCAVYINDNAERLVLRAIKLGAKAVPGRAA